MPSDAEANREERSPAPLQLRLFGTFALLRACVPLPAPRTRKGHWLLALLLLRPGQAVDRAWLAATLWPDSTDTQARDNLRTSLKDLRHVLGPDATRLFAPTPRTLAFDTANAECDLLAFDAAMAKGDITSLERALVLYHGELLEGCDAEWIFLERQTREQAYLSALETLSENARALQSPERAVHYLRRLVSADPLRESAWQRLMRALAEAGDHAAVTAAYRELRESLYRTLNASLSEETTSLYRELRERAEQTVGKATGTPQPASPTGIPLFASVPRPLTPILGRTAEIETISGLLTKVRLVTLTGAGGIGKTRLSLAVAECLRESFPAAVFFIPLVDVAASERLADMVRDGLGLPRAANADPFAQIVAKLSTRASLLLLDNFEHLLGSGTAFVQRLLAQVPSLTLFVTSRQALRLRGEQEYPVPPLPVPESRDAVSVSEQALERIRESASVQLFLMGAKARRPDFAVTAVNASAIARLCRRLDGLPLAIELASAWVHLLTPSQMLTRLAGDPLELLVSTHKDQAERHRTMRAAIDWSFRLLPEPVRQFAAKLSVFRGGWTEEAAQAMCGESQAMMYLGELYDVSLLVTEERNDAMRFRYLETIREYASEQLTAPERQGLAKSHLDFFLAMAEETTLRLTGAEQGVWLDKLETEHDNLRAALAWCSVTDAEGVRAGLRLAVTLQRFWAMRGYYREGEEHLLRLLECAGTETRNGARARALHAASLLAACQCEYARAQRLEEEALTIFRELGERKSIAVSLNNLGTAARHFGNVSLARSLIEESLQIRRELEDRKGIADSLVNLGCMARDLGDLPSARALFEEALNICRELGDRWALTEALHDLGLVAAQQGDYALAWSLHEECLNICREVGNQWGAARSLNGLGSVARRQGDYASARTLFEEALSIFRDLENKQGKADSLRSLGGVAQAQGEYERARTLYEEALGIFRELEHREGIANTILGLGIAACKQGDFVWARARLQESLTLCRDLDYRLSIASALDGLAFMFVAQTEAQKAVRLWGAAQALRESMSAPVPPPKRETFDPRFQKAHSLLGEEAYAAAWAEGQAMPLEEAIVYTLGDTEMRRQFP